MKTLAAISLLFALACIPFIPALSLPAQSPREVLNPKTIRQLTHPQPEITEVVPSSELARLRGEVRSIHDQISIMTEVSKEVAANTQNISRLDYQLGDVTRTLTEHMRMASGDPAHLAVLETKLDAVIVSLAERDKVAIAIFGGLGTIFLAILTIFAKRWASRFQIEAVVQSAFRNSVQVGMQDAKEAAVDAKEAAVSAEQHAKEILAQRAAEQPKSLEVHIHPTDAGDC